MKKRWIYRKKSQIWISAVLYILITAIIMVIVLEAGVPVLRGMRDRSVFTQTKENFITLNQHIRDISNTGPGSQRVVPIEIRKGSLDINNNQISWEMESESIIQEPGTQIEVGDLTISAGNDVNAFIAGDDYIIENFYIRVNFSAIGEEEVFESINTTNIINSIQFKNGGISDGEFRFTINDDSTTISGNGYTSLLTEGYGLGSAELIAHINTSSTEYDIKFIIESQRDYIIVKLI